MDLPLELPLSTDALALLAEFVPALAEHPAASKRFDTPSDGSKRRHGPPPTPEAYARAELKKLTGSDRSDLRSALREMSAKVLPGVPTEAVLGFTSMAMSRSENTGEPDPRTGKIGNKVFHEIGYFQTTAGPAFGPAPNPDIRLPYNNWGALANTVLVTSLLGRGATMVPGAWKWAVRDQTAVGLAHLHGAMRAVSSRIGAAASTSFDTTWAMALAFGAFSWGTVPTANRIKPFASLLGAVPERDRFSAWCGLLDARARAGGPVEPLAHALNMWRKLECGAMAAATLGAREHTSASTWYEAWYDRPTVNPQAWLDWLAKTSRPSAGGEAGSLTLLVTLLVGSFLLSAPAHKQAA